MNITAILNKNFRPLMAWYYKKAYREEIYQMLSLFNESEGMKLDEAVCLMSINYKLPVEKSTKILGICMYLGFIGNK